ncbi:hypothetical protein T484DRAFT_2592606 [Baffinella frigidus]|nr:hypothetical protein T484DRAFT_2592606 [Cryptophyta sp. CCMP2293]
MALLLGKSLDEIEEHYINISTQVFRKGWFSTASQLTYSGAKYDYRILEDLLRQHYASSNLLDMPSSPAVLVVSTLASVVPALPYIWRTYACPVDSPSRYPGTCDAEVCPPPPIFLHCSPPSLPSLNPHGR